MVDPRDALARHGERVAELYLETVRGMTILAHRFRVPGGEVDLIARDGKTLVFVEVKTQRDRKWTDPELRVDAAKRRRLTLAARNYIHLKRADASPCRFDVVAVTLTPDDDSPAEIRHFEDAFPPTGRRG